MPQENGRTKWLLWAAGIIMTFILTALTFMGTSVVANDISSRDRDDDIKVEGVAQERRLGTKLDILQSSINDQKSDILVAIENIKGDIRVYHAND